MRACSASVSLLLLLLSLLSSFLSFQLAQTIADGGEEPTGDDAHRDDVTALMVAAQGGHEAVVRLLVEKGADVRAKDEEGFTPLLNAVKVWCCGGRMKSSCCFSSTPSGCGVVVDECSLAVVSPRRRQGVVHCSWRLLQSTSSCCWVGMIG